jgi:hypothetical protein
LIIILTANIHVPSQEYRCRGCSRQRTGIAFPWPEAELLPIIVEHRLLDRRQMVFHRLLGLSGIPITNGCEQGLMSFQGQLLPLRRLGDFIPDEIQDVGDAFDDMKKDRISRGTRKRDMKCLVVRAGQDRIVQALHLVADNPFHLRNVGVIGIAGGEPGDLGLNHPSELENISDFTFFPMDRNRQELTQGT